MPIGAVKKRINALETESEDTRMTGTYIQCAQMLNIARERWPKMITPPPNDGSDDAAENRAALSEPVATPR